MASSLSVIFALPLLVISLSCVVDTKKMFTIKTTRKVDKMKEKAKLKVKVKERAQMTVKVKERAQMTVKVMEIAQISMYKDSKNRPRPSMISGTSSKPSMMAS